MKLIRLVRLHQIDVIIPTKQKDYVLAGIVSRICKCRNVLRLGIVRKLRHNVIHHLIYNTLADGIIVNAQCIKKRLLESSTISPDKIRVIYNGLDQKRITELSKKIKHDVPFDFIVTGMGELSPRKGFEYLIESFARFTHLSGTGRPGLIIMGQGNMLQQLQECARRYDVEQQVIFTGFLENPYPYLAQSDVFVMTSRNEGISNALLEASLLDNTIITTDSGGGITEIIKHRKNGFLVDDNAPNTLAETLHFLYSNPSCKQQIAKNGRETITQRFSLAHMTKEIIDFCNTL